MSEHVSPHTLWVLIMGVVFFLFGYMFITVLIPPQLQTGNQYSNIAKQLAGSSPDGQFSGTDFNVFNNSETFNLTYYSSVIILYDPSIIFASESKLNQTTGMDIRIFYGTIPFDSISLAPATEGIYMKHYETTLWVFTTAHFLKVKGDGNLASFDFILDPLNYDNATGISTLHFSCAHYSTSLMIQSEFTNETLAQAFYNHDPISCSASRNLDLTLSGNGIFQVLGQIFTFQAVQTEIPLVDIGMNALISVPLYVAIAYIMYRLITGMIPTVSGGGGA